MSRRVQKDWPRYAKALDLYLSGYKLGDIARYFDVSRERARQMVMVAKHRLAFRVFKGVPFHLDQPRAPT